MGERIINLPWTVQTASDWLHWASGLDEMATRVSRLVFSEKRTDLVRVSEGLRNAAKECREEAVRIAQKQMEEMANRPRKAHGKTKEEN